MRFFMLSAVAVGFLVAAHAPALAQDSAMARYEAAMLQAEEELDRDRERRAAGHLNTAEAALSEAGGERSLERGRIAVLRAGVERERRDWDDAFAHIDRAVGLLQAGGASALEYGDAQYSRGFIAYQGEEFVAAEEAFREAVMAYRTSRDLTDTRRLRTNGWYLMAAHRNEAYRNNEERYVHGQGFVSSHVSAYPDPDLARLYPLGEWREPMTLQLPFSAFVGRAHGFVIAQYDLSDSGQPRNVEILASYPGDLFDHSVEESLRTGRRDAGDAGPNGYVTLFSFIVER
tara:strand:- start:2710 stop:3573 length:864 start_codon:yes stop_codon:yes gene_type:complete